MAVLLIKDPVSRKWITEVVSAEETSTQVEIGFTDALEAEGLLDLVERRQDGRIDLAVDDESCPIMLTVSDNGPQMPEPVQLDTVKVLSSLDVQTLHCGSLPNM